MSAGVKPDGCAASFGFPPIARDDARVLVLGSLPGRASLQARQYYAHPRNAFWPIMRELTGASGGYPARCSTLVEHGVAVWDVLAQSERPGSLDADIRTGTAVANDFGHFLAHHRQLQLVCFNGARSQQLFRRFVAPGLPDSDLRYVLLPSTSPAHAAVSRAEKLAAWRGIIGPEILQGAAR